MNNDMTEFSKAWGDFEECLGRFLGDLAKPTLHGIVRLYAPTKDGARHLTIEGRYQHGAEGHVDGVDVRIRGQRSRFHPLDDAIDSIPDAAQEICALLRDEWDVAHPSMLTADSDFVMDVAQRLGLAAPGGIPEEDAEHEEVRRLNRRVARRGGLDVQTRPDEAMFDGEIELPRDNQEARESVERMLMRRFGKVSIDDDNDYRVDVGATRLYLSLSEDQPILRLWKTVVWDVNSRRAATVEANYLNRIHPLTRWVLWGNSLDQEIYVPTAPFIPGLLNEMLDRFAEHYDSNLSALQLRLGEK